MKKALKTRRKRSQDMLEEYDFSGGLRGKYAERWLAGANVVVLAPDVAASFRDSRTVNEALRALKAISRTASS